MRKSTRLNYLPKLTKNQIENLIKLMFLVFSWVQAATKSGNEPDLRLIFSLK